MIDVPQPNFSAESGADSHLDGDVETVSPVISDALDAHGHSIAVRNREFKYITRELTETADTDAVHTPPEGGFDVSTDQGERKLLDREFSPRCTCRESGQYRKPTVGTRTGRRRVLTNRRAPTGATGLQDVINRGSRDPLCLILPIESVQRSCSSPLYPIIATLRIASRIYSVECRG